MKVTPGSVLAASAGTALVYFVVGWVSLTLAIPPTYASPLYPPAGIALACLLGLGWRAMPGVALGALLVNTYTASLRGPLEAAAMVVPLATGLGASLQAAVGHGLIRRFVEWPLVLNDSRAVVRFFAMAVPAGCTVSASVATLAFVATGTVTPGNVGFLWWTWWAGDTLGVLIATPIVLTLIGQPRAEWAHRRVSVALPLLLITGLLAAAVLQVARWDQERQHAIFDRDAAAATASLSDSLRQPLQALHAMNGLYVASNDVSAGELQQAMAHWLQEVPALRAVGYSAWVERSRLPAFEAEARAEVGPGFRVFDRADAAQAAGGAGDPESGTHAMVIRLIEPLAVNQAALGLNQRSVPAAREAIDRARRTGLQVASPGFALTQAPQDGLGVVVYQALYRTLPRSSAATAEERARDTRGALFVTLQPGRAVQGAQAQLPRYLALCLWEDDARQGRRLLGGGAACTASHGDDWLRHRAEVVYAGRPWEVEVLAPASAVPDGQRGSAFLFSLVSLGATSLLGALLLAVTGRAHRIEVAVADRTADLRREVTERQRTEAALRDSEQQLRAIFDTARVGIVYTDLAGRILTPNPAYCELLGLRADQLRQRTMADLTHPDDRLDEAHQFAQLARGACDTYRRAKRYLRADGEVIHVQLTMALLRDDQGQPYRTVGVVEDVSERLRRADAERARDAAQAANRAKSDFVSRMSHELRTPLNAMLGFAQLLDLDRQQPLAPHQAAWTSQIQQAGWHLLHMINDTLDLSRIESGMLALRPETLDLAALVEATRSLVDQSAQRRGVRVSTDLDPRAASVTGDLTRVKQILTNLLSNAVKYNVAGGSVTVTSRPADEPDMVEIDVQDTGLGMSEEQLAQLFQPFNRLGREHSAEEGTGIGLVISQRLAELMRGTLTARSTAGHGTVFTLTLPRGGSTVDPVHAAGGSEPLSARYRQRLVHYVEDNETNAEVMRGVLAKRPQIRLEVSTLGLDGVSAIRRERPSLVLLDMHLPDIGGLDLLRHLKDDPQTEDIPVVVVSADATAATVAEALRAGAAHYVTKPVNIAEILAVVDEQLNQQDTRFG